MSFKRSVNNVAVKGFQDNSRMQNNVDKVEYYDYVTQQRAENVNHPALKKTKQFISQLNVFLFTAVLEMFEFLTVLQMLLMRTFKSSKDDLKPKRLR